MYSGLLRGPHACARLAATRFPEKESRTSPHAHTLVHAPTRLPARTHACTHRIHFGFYLCRSLCIVGYINKSADAVVQTRIPCMSLGSFVCASVCVHVRVRSGQVRSGITELTTSPGCERVRVRVMSVCVCMALCVCVRLCVRRMRVKQMRVVCSARVCVPPCVCACVHAHLPL